MEESFTLGRIKGIRVSANWSVLVVLWLLAWGLAAERFPAEAPGYSSRLYWLAALCTAIAFLVSLVAHEVGHALVARRNDVEVEGITLWVFGGVARIRGEANAAAAELRIAGIGPAVSLGIALLSVAVGTVLDRAGAPALLVDSLRWFAGANALLGIFNLIPAFPLDGGRVLRAILWSRRGDRIEATITAARVGLVFGYLLIGAGLLEFATLGELISGIWLVFLGWFLLSAARGEESHILVQRALAGVQVRDAMSTDVMVAPGWLTIDRFIDDYALRHNYAAFPVRDFDGIVTGLVTISHLLSVPATDRDVTRVRDVATSVSALPVGTPDEPLAALIGRMELGPGAGYALIFEGHTLVGLLSPSDITRVIRLAAARDARLTRRVAPAA